MDESGGAQLPLFNQFDAQDDFRQCSVRGCGNSFPASSRNKMCEVCRGRHRTYATTKRARRKMEKAIIQGKSIASLTSTRVSKKSTSTTQPAQVASTSASVDDFRSTQSPEISQTSMGWNHSAIDPRLFITPASSSSSELAGALTLPTHATRQQDPQHTEQGSDLATAGPSHATQQAFAQEASNSSGTLTSRLCSVKGCRLPMPEAYTYKMCESCRNKYRGYGTTKRAKWRAERALFDKELANLRREEEERRARDGLPPLSDSPQERREWELSIIDAKMLALPSPSSHLQDTIQAMAALGAQTQNGTLETLSAEDVVHRLQRSDLSAVARQLEIIGTSAPLVLNLTPPDSSSGADPALIIPPVLPLAARLCSVSHCHKILPDGYRFKRCQQHRLQNRYHSQLKRVREKGSNPREVEESEEVEEDDGEGGTRTVLRKRGFICSNDDCSNILDQGVRWRLCDTCRDRKRQSKPKRAKAGMAGRHPGSMILDLKVTMPSVDGSENPSSMGTIAAAPTLETSTTRQLGESSPVDATSASNGMTFLPPLTMETYMNPTLVSTASVAAPVSSNFLTFRVSDMASSTPADDYRGVVDIAHERNGNPISRPEMSLVRPQTPAMSGTLTSIVQEQLNPTKASVVDPTSTPNDPGETQDLTPAIEPSRQHPLLQPDAALAPPFESPLLPPEDPPQGHQANKEAFPPSDDQAIVTVPYQKALKKRVPRKPRTKRVAPPMELEPGSSTWTSRVPAIPSSLSTEQSRPPFNPYLYTAQSYPYSLSAGYPPPPVNYLYASPPYPPFYGYPPRPDMVPPGNPYYAGYPGSSSYPYSQFPPHMPPLMSGAAPTTSAPGQSESHSSDQGEGLPIEARVEPGPSPSLPSVGNAEPIHVATSVDARNEIPADTVPTSLQQKRVCKNRSCHRAVVAKAGMLCDRCRVRIKKHNTEAKLRLKLEPRKSVLKVETSIIIRGND